MQVWQMKAGRVRALSGQTLGKSSGLKLNDLSTRGGIGLFAPIRISYFRHLPEEQQPSTYFTPYKSLPIVAKMIFLQSVWVYDGCKELKSAKRVEV